MRKFCRQGGRKTEITRLARMQPPSVKEAWSMYFVADQLADGSKIPMMTNIDVYTTEALAIA